MLVEFHSNGISTFMLAEVSNHDVEDIRAMFFEDKFKDDGPMTAAKLYEKLPVVLPMDPKEVLRPAKKEEVKKKDVDHDKIMFLLEPDKLKDMPKWEWDQIFKVLGPQPKTP